MEGIDKALRRLVTFIDEVYSNTEEESGPTDPTEGLTLKELQMNARVRRLVGIPPCMDIHQDLSCRCCVFDT